MARRRRFHTADDKIRILRRLLADDLSLSEITKEYDIHRALVQRWKHVLLTQGALAFRRSPQAATLSQDAHEPSKTIVRNPKRLQKVDEAGRWILALSQGLYAEASLAAELKGLSHDDIATLLQCIESSTLRYRTRAIAILSHFKGIRVSTIASLLGISHSAVDNNIARFAKHGCKAVVSPFSSNHKKINDADYKDAVFSILHAPPSSYGINRTTWRLRDIQLIMRKKGLGIAKNNISKIIRNAGYRYRKAKKVLTGTAQQNRASRDLLTSATRPEPSLSCSSSSGCISQVVSFPVWFATGV
jgi:transposase